MIFLGRNTRSGNILESIWINKENIDRIYLEAGRRNIKETNSIIRDVLDKNKFTQEWIEAYRKDMIDYLEIKHKPNNLFPLELAEDIIKVLKTIDGGQENLKRVLSIKCFGDSKYFERNIEHILIRIIKKYLLENELQEEYDNDDILLEVRNFQVSRSNRILRQSRIYDK